AILLEALSLWQGATVRAALCALERSASARNLARRDQPARALPALAEQPALRPPHQQGIVSLADRPHPRLSLQLGPVGKTDRTRDRVAQPCTRRSVAILPVLAEVRQHVPDRVAGLRGRRDHLDMVTICEHLAAARPLTVTERTVDVTRRRDCKALHPAC